MRLNNFLNEGIIKVSIGKYRKILEALEDKIISNSSNVITILNDAFKNENIKFIDTDNEKIKTSSIQSGYTSATRDIIEIYLNSKLLKKLFDTTDEYEDLIHDILSLLVHESTHMKQFDKMKVIKKSDLKITDDHHELMAYANQTVFEILNNGADDLWDVLDTLKSGKNVQSETYVAITNILDKKGIQQYLKYVYMYIDDILDKIKNTVH